MSRGHLPMQFLVTPTTVSEGFPVLNRILLYCCSFVILAFVVGVGSVRAQDGNLGDITDDPGTLTGTITLNAVEDDWYSFRLSKPRFIAVERIHGSETDADLCVYRAPVSIPSQSEHCANIGDTNLLLQLNTSDQHRAEIGPIGNGEYYFRVTAGMYDVPGAYEFRYSTRRAPDVALSVTELTLAEGGAPGSYTVHLTDAPSRNLEVRISSDNDDVKVSPNTLTFTPANWNSPETVMVSAVDDADSDAETATLSHTLIGYQVPIEGGTVTVNVTDDDVAGVTLTPTALTVLEGGSENYSVVLSSKPSGDVTVDVSSDNADVTVSPESLTFTPATWEVLQTVEVTAAQDADGDADTATLAHSVRGYGDLADGGVVAVTVSDDDTAGIRLPPTALTVREGETGTYPVSLTTAPSGDVEVTPRSTNPHIKFTPTSLTFDSDNWDKPQEISFRIEERNTSPSVTIWHEVEGYGDLNQRWEVKVILHSPDSVRKQTVESTVAGVAAAAVSNVSSNIGARFSAPSGGASVSLAGTPVAFGSAARNRSVWTFADRVEPPDEDSRQSWKRTMSGSELLRSSTFQIALGAAEGNNGSAADVGRQFTLWGRGDFQVFESGGGQKSGYDGDMVAGYLGADITTDGSWLVGMAVSRIAAEANYTLSNSAPGGGTGGRIEADLTNLHPYVRVAVDERSEAWAILGFGKGEVTDTSRAAAPTEKPGKSDLSMRMVSAGARHRLNTDMGIDLALFGDGSLAEISTDEGVEAVDGISASVWRGRAGVEASYTSVWDGGSSLTSFVEVAARKDGGDATEGVGLEVSPGLAFSNPGSGFSIEARARALALHSADNHREYGASITASLTPGFDGLGLSMAVVPTWGTPDNSLDSIDASLFPRDAGTDRGAESFSLNSRVSYGLAAGRGVLAPFAEFSLDNGDRSRARIGSRYSLGPSAVVELFGDRMGGGAGGDEHSVQIRARIGF